MKVVMAEIRAGICGFRTQVRAEGDDKYGVSLEVTSDCEKVRGLGADLDKVGVFDELRLGNEGAILGAAHRHLKGCCAACVVPVGVFKAMQVAGGVALPADVGISLHLEN